MTEAKWIPAYEGNDMVSYIFKKGFSLSLEPDEVMKSITNVRDTAVIVTNYNVWRVRPCHEIGFCLERVCRL